MQNVAERKPAMNTRTKKILICDQFAVEALVYLRKNSAYEIVVTPTLELLHQHLPDADGIIIRSKVKIDGSFLDKAKKLQVIVTCTSGYDHLCFDEIKKRNIIVMYTPEANQISAAEHTWALLLACCRHLPQAYSELKQKNWNRAPYMGCELHGKVIGIIGLGRIGSRVAKIANAFGMSVLAFDPYCAAEVFTDTNAQRASYEEVLRQADVISYHVPKTKETYHMLNRVHFEIINPDAIIINTSRGSVIHEDDLAQALLENKIKAAGLDVFEKEPLDQHSKLMKCKNAVITPHLGAYTEEAFLKASMQGAIQMDDYFSANKIKNSLPLDNAKQIYNFAEGN